MILREWLILIFVWIVTFGSVFFIPRDKYREANVAFLFTQLLTWLFGLLVVQMGWIAYPVRAIFPDVNKTSFTFEYFTYPMFCVFFNIFYPARRRLLYRFGYYAAYCSAITIVEMLIEKNTQLIKYIHWAWYWTWISLYITFYISHLFYVWFFRESAGSPSLSSDE